MRIENANHPKKIHILGLAIFTLLLLIIPSSASIFDSFDPQFVFAQLQEMTTTAATDNRIATVTAANPVTPVLPKSLLVTDSAMGDTQLPWRSSIINDKPLADLNASTAGREEGKLGGYFPIVAFHFETQPVGFDEDSAIVKHIVTGPIKFYDSPDTVLEEANYWKDVPLDKRVALEIDHPGLHYFIAAVQFANGTSGIYAQVMDINALGIKPSSDDSIQLSSADVSSGVVKIDQSEMKASESDPVFQQVASKIICSDLSNNGFEVCGAGKEDAVLEEDNGNRDAGSDDEESAGSNDAVRGDGGKDGKYDVNNCTGKQCEDADKETEDERNSDDCEINPDLCKGSDGGDEDDGNEAGEGEEQPEN